MESKLLIEKARKTYVELENEIEILKIEKIEVLQYAQYALMATDEAIRKMKSWVIIHQFSCWENEITFFKEIKPLFTSKFIYYSKVIALLSSLPAAGAKFKKKIFEEELQILNNFFRANTEFVSYTRRNATYLDLKYFIRNKYDLDLQLALDIHNYDERFSTSHDRLVAYILAYDEYETFLKNQLKELQEGTPTIAHRKKEELHWSSTKSSLVELIYALYTNHCFNGGNIELSEVIRNFEKSFNIDLASFYKTLHEIKNRKINRTKFLKSLHDHLEMTFLASDE